MSINIENLELGIWNLESGDDVDSPQTGEYGDGILAIFIGGLAVGKVDGFMNFSQMAVRGV